MRVGGDIVLKSTLNKKGHITVFLSLILTLILSLVCTTIESARMQGVRMQLQNITDMSIFSVFGEYNKDLFELYDLFFLDTGYGTNDGTSGRVNARIEEYTEYNTDVNKGMLLFGYADMWRIKLSQVSTQGYVMATDLWGKAYYSQAVSYMKDKVGVDVAEALLERYDGSLVERQNEYQDASNTSQTDLATIDAEKSNYQTRYNLEVEEAEEEDRDVEMDEPPEVSNPLDTIRELQSSSILRLVVEDYDEISNEQFRDYRHRASKRTLNMGDGIFEGQSNSAINNVFFNEYIFEKFPHYLSDLEDEPDGLNYQAEFVLCGENTDKKNLEGVVNKLLLMREGINFAYLVSNATKRTVAVELATAIIGYLGIPALVIALAAALLLAWAFAESVLEVRMLLSGKKVALVKNSRNWNLELSNLANLSTSLDSGREARNGIDYEGYLKMLMYFEDHNKKTMRSLDLIERGVQEKSGNEAFRIDNCTQQMNTIIAYEAGSLFLRMPFPTLERGLDRYNYSVTRDFSYY
jgi:hypothetical protein